MLAPVGQDRAEAVEVAADRGERQFPVRPAALAAHDLHPLADLAGDAVGEGVDVVVDGALDGGALPGGVGDDHAAVAEELQDSPDGGAGAGVLSALMSASGTGASAPSQASRIRRVLVALLREAAGPAAGPGMPVELVDEGAGRGGEGGQLVRVPRRSGSSSRGGRRTGRPARGRPGAARPAAPAACRAGGCDRLPGGGDMPGACWRPACPCGSRAVSATMPGAGALRAGGTRAGAAVRAPGLQYPAGVLGADDQQAGAAEPVAADVAHPAAAQAGGLAGEGPAPLGAGSAAGVLPHLAPAEADRALPDRPSPRCLPAWSVRRQRPAGAAVPR